jgi:hypothetical protein
MVLQALNFIHPRKPTQLLTAWKISSHTMICVTKTMKGGWRLELKLLEAVDNKPPERIKPRDLEKIISSL